MVPQTTDGMTCQKDTAPDNTILRPITFASKSLTSAEVRYSNSKREALGILHGPEKFHHYCFARELSIINNHKPLVATFKMNPTHSPKMHEYWVRIIYMLGPELSIADWLSRHNYMENNNEEIHGMDIRINAIQMSMKIPECISIPQIQQVTVHNVHLQQLKGTSLQDGQKSKTRYNEA